MAKEKDQTQDNETKDDDQEAAAQVAEAAAEKEEAAAMAKATKTSEAFDKLQDESEEPAEDDIPASEDAGGDEDDSAAKQKDAKAAKSEKASDEDDSAGAQDEDEQEAAKEDGDTSESQISEELLQQGRDIGLLDEEMAAYTNEADLRHTISIMARLPDEPDVQDEPAQPPASEPAKKAEVKDNGFKLEFKNEDDIDPEILANLKGMQKHIESQAKENAELRKQVGVMTAGVQEQEKTRFMTQFDELIGKTELASKFGEGPTDKLSKRSSAHRNRIAVRSRMGQLGQGLDDAAYRDMGIEGLFGLAVDSLYGKQTRSIASKKVQQKGSARIRGARVGKPASRRTGSLTGEQKAVQRSKDFDRLIDISED